MVESKNTSYVGTQGIMIRETDNTFGIMTANDKFRGGSLSVLILVSCISTTLVVDYNLILLDFQDEICLT